MELHQQLSSSPKELAPSARGIRLSDNIDLSAAIASSTQNKIATGLYSEAIEPTEGFMPSTFWVEDVHAAGHSSKEAGIKLLADVFQADHPSLKASVQQLNIIHRKMLVLDNKVQHDVPFLSAVITSTSSHEEIITFACTYGKTGSALGSMPIIANTGQRQHRKPTFRTASGCPTSRFFQPGHDKNLATEYGILAAVHSTGTHLTTDTAKMVGDHIQKTLLSIAGPPTAPINDVASNPILRLFEYQAIESIADRRVFLFLRDHEAAGILKDMQAVELQTATSSVRLTFEEDVNTTESMQYAISVPTLPSARWLTPHNTLQLGEAVVNKMEQHCTQIAAEISAASKGKIKADDSCIGVLQGSE